MDIFDRDTFNKEAAKKFLEQFTTADWENLTADQLKQFCKDRNQEFSILCNNMIRYNLSTAPKAPLQASPPAVDETDPLPKDPTVTQLFPTCSCSAVDRLVTACTKVFGQQRLTMTLT
jgi:hypothetical protein